MLERVPEEHFDWKPHEKSMTLQQLAGHVATMPIWCALSARAGRAELYVAAAYSARFHDRDALLNVFDENAAKVRAAFQRMDDAALEQTWTLKNGDQVMHIASRAYVLRVWCVNHMIHHRGQLCLFLKMLGVPVPAVYFNSVDEPEMKFD